MVEVIGYKKKVGRQYQLGLEPGERLVPGMQPPPRPLPPYVPYVPPPPEEPPVRERLMDNTAMAIAFDGGADDTIYIGLPEGDTTSEYYLVDLASEQEKKAFERVLLHHYEENLKDTEREWLGQQVGAVVEEDSGVGYVSVYFYESPADLAEAWKQHGLEANEENGRLIEEAIKSGELSPSGEPFPRSQTRFEVAGPDEYGRVHNPEAPREF